MFNEDKYHHERIAKAIARSGVCSRRQAEALIKDGRVKINGRTVSEPATKVTDKDKIEVNHKMIQRDTVTRLWLYHKPPKTLVTRDDPLGRQTFLSHWSGEVPHVISVGRLDYNSEGLLLLTNNGEFARQLCLPKNGIKRIYKVRVFGGISQEAINRINQGLVINGVHYEKAFVKILSQSLRNAWLLFELTEGKNREIRNIVQFMGWKVGRLIRTAYGPFTLGTLAPGKMQEVSSETVKEVESQFLSNIEVKGG